MTRIINKILIISLLASIGIVSSCKDVYEKELEDIDKYVAENYPGATKYDNGLYMYWEEAGEGDTVKLNDYVGVNYVGTFLDGDEFDSSNAPFYFYVGNGQVIHAWDFGIQQTRVGDKVVMVTPSSLAYGSYGMPPRINGYTPLKFEIEVLSVSK